MEELVPNQIDCWAEKYLIELIVFKFFCAHCFFEPCEISTPIQNSFEYIM